MRLDKYLKVSRLIKRRTVANEACDAGRVLINDKPAKASTNVKEGDIIVAGRNFGCGSSREHAPIAIKASGISCVIAATFARIFFRNSINIGLPILECPEAAKEIQDGDIVSVDLSTGTIVDKTTGKEYKAEPFPPFMQKLIEAGGLAEYIKENY